MAKEAYKKQVALLLNILPEVAKEPNFALHGGTAINLFARNMPRLSVDVDLTYIPIEDRDSSLQKIDKSLERITGRIEKDVPRVKVYHRRDAAKLLVSVPGADVKVEVNVVIRGVLGDPATMTLCDKAQNDFEAFCAINVIPNGQLYGGKICAALDRQHPRDLFDIKYLFQNEGITEEIKEGFLLCLLSSDRPIQDVLYPNLQDQRSAMDNQFAGMSNEVFSYEEYEATRSQLVKSMRESLTVKDKEFLLSVKNVTPDWTAYNFERFPAVAWKLQNLQRLKEGNPKKHLELLESLKRRLFS